MAKRATSSEFVHCSLLRRIIIAEHARSSGMPKMMIDEFSAARSTAQLASFAALLDRKG
jgi:hypothetical protein